MAETVGDASINDARSLPAARPDDLTGITSAGAEIAAAAPEFPQSTRSPVISPRTRIGG
ncbi:hypothetical protein [Nocardia cerradoensis]|uniref:hypothetical protein n=1 Tax=Nocardia cerradoensis TaxID=85688 RepID=UPI0012F6A2AA|nr:hypothetical protein [Nocardia cerradoensis]NKY42499.1 hypothetical protein [Nocardia cerradoensis]